MVLVGAQVLIGVSCVVWCSNDLKVSLSFPPPPPAPTPTWALGTGAGLIGLGSSLLSQTFPPGLGRGVGG